MAPRFSNPTLQKLLTTAKGKSYTVSVVTVGLIIILLLVGVFPVVSSVFFQVSENQNKQQALTEIAEKSNTLTSLVQQEQTKRAVSLALDEYLPDGIGQEGVYTTINEIVGQTGVELASISFSDIEKRRSLRKEFKVGKTIAAKVLKISVRGSRSQLEKFITQLESARRIINILNLSEYKVDDPGVYSGDYRLEIQAEVYYWEKNE